MKKTKVWLIIAVLIVLISLYIRSEYRFCNGLDSIESIKLMQRINEESGDPSDYILLRELNASEISSFMNEIYSFDTQKGGTPPRWGYGEFIAKVKYTNGDVEILGSYCIEFIRSGEDQSGVGTYYFTDEAAFLALIQQYTTSSKLPG